MGVKRETPKAKNITGMMILLLLFYILGLWLTASVSWAAVAAGTKGYITREDVTFRKEPIVNQSNKIGIIPYASQVQIIGHIYKKDSVTREYEASTRQTYPWYKVKILSGKYAGKSGWIFGFFFSREQPKVIKNASPNSQQSNRSRAINSSAAMAERDMKLCGGLLGFILLFGFFTDGGSSSSSSQKASYRGSSYGSSSSRDDNYHERQNRRTELAKENEGLSRKISEMNQKQAEGRWDYFDRSYQPWSDNENHAIEQEKRAAEEQHEKNEQERNSLW